MTEHLLFIDLSHLIHRCVSKKALSTMHNSAKEPTGGVYGVIQSIHKCLKQDTSITKVYLLKDGYPKWRKDLFPDYKANRSSNPASPYYQSYIKPNAFGWSVKDSIDYTNRKINEVANLLGMRIVYNDYLEADDLAYIIAKEMHENNNNKDIKLTFMTSDQDWLQLIQIFPDVQIYDGIKDELITFENFERLRNYNPKWFFFKKAMLGDKSDNIPSALPKLGEKGILHLLELLDKYQLDPEDPNFEMFLQNLAKNISDEERGGRFKIIKEIDKQVFDRYNNNMKLIDFRRCPYDEVVAAQVRNLDAEPISFQPLGAMQFYKKMEFKELAYTIMTGSPFERLH